MEKYKGWIPTVSGRLSFSVLGDTTHPTRAVGQNVADDKHRYLIAYQKRVLIDAALPLKTVLARRFLRLEGVFWCLCVAKSSNEAAKADDSLEGRLYLFNGKSMWRGPTEQAVRSAQRELGGFRDRLAPVNLEDYFGGEFRRLRDELVPLSSFYVDFHLKRNGETTITPPHDFRVLSEDAPHFPEEKDKRAHLLHVVCSQLFFFLRDVSHEHQHHDPRTDTIVDIYQVESDDYSWRASTLQVLLRKVLQYKREKGANILNSSLGTLAYANSFRTISEETLIRAADDKFQANGDKISPTVNDSALEQSIRAAQESLTQETNEKIRNAEWFRNLFFGALGTVLMLIGLLKLTADSIDAEPHPLLLLIARYFIENTWLSMTIIGVIIFFGMAVLGAVDFLRWRFVRGTIRIVQVFPREISILIMIAISIACGALAQWIITTL